jgi:hypothetical protein
VRGKKFTSLLSSQWLSGLRSSSFIQGSTGCAFVYEEQVFKYLLRSFNILCHLLSFLFIWQLSRLSYHICTDFLSALQSLKDTCWAIQLFWRFCSKCSTPQGKKSVVFFSVPDLIGLPGNEAISAAMEEATLLGNMALD